MHFIENLFSPLQNCEATALTLCKALRLSITRASLVDAIKTHPDYPSMLSISDIMSNFRVNNVSLKVNDADKLIDLTLPFVAQIKSEQAYYPLFAVVLDLSKDTITWLSPISQKKEKISFRYFQSIFTGFVQCYEVGVNSGEKDFAVNRKKEQTSTLVNSVLAVSIPILTLILSIVAISIDRYNAIASVAYTLLVLVGVVTSSLLVLYDINQYNPTLQKVCTGGKKTNCAAILHSKASKICGIHWSVIGFSYFMGVLAVLLAGGILNTTLLSVASWLNIFTLPYSIYSIYYQARIAKQWCPICLTVQAVLALLFTTSFIGGFLSTSLLSVYSFLPFITSIGLVFLSVYLLLLAIEKTKFTEYYLQSLQRIKHNPQVFGALLAKQKQITESTDGLGITLGNPNGKYHLLKVCNPYCKPCISAHPIIDELLEKNPEVRLQIIFTSTSASDDLRNKPVKNLLAVKQTSSDTEVKKALDDWYLAENKDYEYFNTLHSYSQEVLDNQLPQIQRMNEWCEKVSIEFTPTFFLNNHQLPEFYSVTDLRYLLSV